MLLHENLTNKTPMMNKLCFQAFDRTLRDIMRATNQHNANKLGQ